MTLKTTAVLTSDRAAIYRRNQRLRADVVGQTFQDIIDSKASLDGDGLVTPSQLPHRGFVHAGDYITGNGEADDTTPLEAAVQDIPSSGGVLLIPAGANCRITQVELPQDRDIFIEGYGATISTVTGEAAFNRLPANQGAADVAVAYRVGIQGLRFTGNRTAGQKAVCLGATYKSFLRDCRLESFDTAFDGQFCLSMALDNNLSSDNASDAYIARAGTWTGATTANSQSNHTRFSHLRDYARAGANASFTVLASSGIHIEDCISEGITPVNNIIFDNQNGTNVREFTVRNLHSENIPTNAIVKLIGNSRLNFELDGIYFQSASTIIDASDIVNSDIGIRRVANFPAGSQFDTGVLGNNNVWTFFGNVPDVDLYDAATWVDEVIPRGLFYINTNHLDGAGNVNLLFDVGEVRELFFNANLLNMLRDSATDFGRTSSGRLRDIHLGRDLLLGGEVRVDGTKVLGAQGAAIADLTAAATSGTLPTPNGAVTIVDATTPTNAELLEFCMELKAKLDTALARDRAHGLIAT